MQTKNSVSVIITNGNDQYLVVKRPDDPNDDISGVWGFPAASAIGSESETDTALRVGVSKLGVTLALTRRIGESTHARGDIKIHLVDYEATIIAGQPHVPQSDSSITQYVDWMFTDDPLVVVNAARLGSQCTQIFLDDLGIAWR